MAKSHLPLLLGLAALGGLAFTMQKPGDLVTGKSGSAWRVQLVSHASGVKTYDIFTAATGELVLRYSQTGSDMTSRKLVAVGQGVEASVIRTAGSDFGVPVPGGS